MNNWMTKIDRDEWLALGGHWNSSLRTSLDAQGDWQYFRPTVPIGRPGRSTKADRRMVANWMDRFEAARALKGN